MQKTRKSMPSIPVLKKLVNQKAWKFIKDLNSSSEERLERLAAADGRCSYTYKQMFREWDRYAAVFTALHMTEKESARVGLLGSDAAEVVFSLYALNMVGAEVSLLSSFNALKKDAIIKTIKAERLTDIIITDDFVQAKFAADLFENKELLGLRNVILLHVPVCGTTVDESVTLMHEAKYKYAFSSIAPICMETLLFVYGSDSIYHASQQNSKSSIIMHTSGTTSGSGTPIALTDKQFNSILLSFNKLSGYDEVKNNFVSAVIVDLSNAYGLINQVHVPLAFGGSIIFAPYGALNPNMHRIIAEYGVTILFCVSAMVEMWMKSSETAEFDFLSLKSIVLGGAAASSKDKRRYYKFFRDHGCGEIPLINGYGISELGGACILSTPDIYDESIGYPMPGVDVKIYDEESGKYLGMDDAPCCGVMYLSAEWMTRGELDGQQVVRIRKINRRKYVCTNDYVSVDKTGRITYIGRANRYFINDSGRKYDSGIVETEFAKQEGIACCCIVPIYIKLEHDNYPMLCVCPVENDQDAAEIIRKALFNVFITKKSLSPDDVPLRILVVNEMPRNGNGKIDTFAMSEGKIEGRQYAVKTIKPFGTIKDFILVPVLREEDDMIQRVYKDIASDLDKDINGEVTDMEVLSDSCMQASFNGF